MTVLLKSIIVIRYFSPHFLLSSPHFYTSPPTLPNFPASPTKPTYSASHTPTESCPPPPTTSASPAPTAPKTPSQTPSSVLTVLSEPPLKYVWLERDTVWCCIRGAVRSGADWEQCLKCRSDSGIEIGIFFGYTLGSKISFWIPWNSLPNHLPQFRCTPFWPI